MNEKPCVRREIISFKLLRALSIGMVERKKGKYQRDAVVLRQIAGPKYTRKVYKLLLHAAIGRIASEGKLPLMLRADIRVNKTRTHDMFWELSFVSSSLVPTMARVGINFRLIRNSHAIVLWNKSNFVSFFIIWSSSFQRNKSLSPRPVLGQREPKKNLKSINVLMAQTVFRPEVTKKKRNSPAFDNRMECNLYLLDYYLRRHVTLRVFYISSHCWLFFALCRLITQR